MHIEHKTEQDIQGIYHYLLEREAPKGNKFIPGDYLHGPLNIHD